MATGDNYIQCGNDIDLQSIFMSLLANANGCGLIRSYCVPIQSFTTCTSINCGTFEDFLDLLRQSIAIADDGLPALRVVTLQVDEQNPITPFMACAQGITYEEALNSIFVQTSEGTAILTGCVNEEEG